MADFTYQTRSKLRETWVNRVRGQATGLTAAEKELLPGTGNGISTKSTEWLTELLRQGTYRTLSALFKGRLSGLVAVCVPKEQQEEFFFVGLRLVRGVSLKEFERRFGVPATAVYPGVMERFVREGAARLENGWFKLTELGLDVSNYVMRGFLQE